MKALNYFSVVWQEEKYFVAQCLNVEISSFGKSKNEALSNLKEALELYFEDEPNTKITKIGEPELYNQLLTYA